MYIIGLLFILLACASLLLYKKAKWHPYIIAIDSLGMILLMSLAGRYLVGSDIHLEYFYTKGYAGYMFPQITWTPQSTSAATYLAAWLPWSPLWTLKLLYPILFSSVPVIMYFVFRKWVEAEKAFLAVFVFIAFPSFFMELPGIARQMTAEVLLAIALYLIVVKKSWWALLPAALIPLFHYSMAIVSVVLLLPAILLAKGSRKLVGSCLGAVIVVSSIYFPLAHGGVVYDKLAYLYNDWTPKALHIPAPTLTVPEQAILPTDQGPQTVPPSKVPFLSRYESVLQSGLGLDFFQVNIWGKLFRVIQWAITILGLVGLWKLKKNRWIYGGVLLVLLMVVPGFSSILNATRVVQLSLFLLAPTVAVALRPRLLIPILAVYLLFTSGFIFEVTGQTDLTEVSVPYSIGLSDHRIDLGASETSNDLAVRDYIASHSLFPVISDISGSDLLGEDIGWRDDLNVSLFRDVSILHNCYVFVRTRDIKDGQFMVWDGVGCRIPIPPSKYGADWNKNIIYQQGDARVVWVP